MDQEHRSGGADSTVGYRSSTVLITVWDIQHFLLPMSTPEWTESAQEKKTVSRSPRPRDVFRLYYAFVCIFVHIPFPEKSASCCGKDMLLDRYIGPSPRRFVTFACRGRRAPRPLRTLDQVSSRGSPARSAWRCWCRSVAQGSSTGSDPCSA